jgi:hypothetical protein
MLEYDAIKRSRAAGEKVLDLKGGTFTAVALNDCGSFTCTGDGRILLTSLDCKMTAKQCWSFSFDRSTLRCKECGPHGDRPFLRAKGDKSGGREVIVLADQAFPPILPADSDKRCVKIARLEDGSLDELAKEWVDMSRHKEISRGTVLLLGSLSHMRRMGTVGYCEDFVAASKLITDANGGKVLVVPLPVLFTAGSSSPDAIKTAAEVAAWAMHEFGGVDWFMADSYRLAMSFFTTSDHDICQQDHGRRVTLPSIDANTGLPSERKLVCWTGGWSNLKKTVRPQTSADEQAIVTSLLEELRSRLALDVCVTPNFDRAFRQPKSEKKYADYIILGSSNALRMSDSLNKMGFSTACVHSKGWRANPTSVTSFVAQTKAILSTTTSDVVVIHALDNSIFLGKTDDGGLLPAQRGPDGCYHIVGDLEVASKERQFEIYNLLKPLLDLVRDKRVVFVAPMPRYTVNSCCDEREHISNRFQRDFKSTLTAKLADLKGNLKSFLFMNGYKNTVVLDPAVDLRDKRDEDIWGDDPVHPREEFYLVLARSVTILEAGGKNKRRAEDNDDPPAKAQRPGPAASRGREPSWRGGGGSIRGRGRGGLHVDLERPVRGGHVGTQRGRGDHSRRVYFRE